MATTSEFAKYLNITQKQLRYLEQTGVLRKVAHNDWDAMECAGKYIRHLQESRGQSPEEKYRERLMAAKAEIAEMDAAERSGELCDYEDIMRIIDDEQIQIRTAITTRLPRVVSLLDLPASAREREIAIRWALTKELKSIVRGKVTRKTRKAKDPGADRTS